MKTKMLKTGNEMSINYSALENFALTKEDMVKLFGGTSTGTSSSDDTPPPIVKDNGED